MTIFNLILVLCTQLCAVTGQIFVKKSMTHPDSGGKGRGGLLLAAGIGVDDGRLFLWLGLMPKFNLSYLFPFEALHYIFIIFAAALFLKERAPLSLWIGGILICAGIIVVSAGSTPYPKFKHENSASFAGGAFVCVWHCMVHRVQVSDCGRQTVHGLPRES